MQILTKLKSLKHQEVESVPAEPAEVTEAAEAAEAAEVEEAEEAAGEPAENRIQTAGSIILIPAEKIIPNKSQPRVIFDDYALTQLAVSIQQNGILQPVTVREPNSGGEYELIAGERRVRAAALVGLEFIPAIVTQAGDGDSAVLAALENIQREDLNYIEEAGAIRRIMQEYGLSQRQAAARLGLAQSTVANKLRLLTLSDEHAMAALRYRLMERQCRALLRLPETLRGEAIHKIGTDSLNTVDTEKLIDSMLAPEKPKPKPKKGFTALTAAKPYINTFNRTLSMMKQSGINYEAKKNTTDDYTEYIIRIHNDSVTR
ncbi:nucleoid occlusion protein [Clostridia bacterium]|nr:nucleoid occlusion protein [Clostridia bacterium]